MGDNYLENYESQYPYILVSQRLVFNYEERHLLSRIKKKLLREEETILLPNS